MAKTLTSRKQEFVRDGIFEAAIDLFVHKGFQETTVDDVALAAGVSRRSFFRYFTTKDHLLGHNMVKLGDVLVAAVAASPAESSANQVVHDAVMAGLPAGLAQCLQCVLVHSQIACPERARVPNSASPQIIKPCFEQTDLVFAAEAQHIRSRPRPEQRTAHP